MYILYNHFNITYTILLKHTTFNLFPFKHSITTALSTSLSTCRTKYAACYICDSIVRSDWYRTIHVDSLCGSTCISLCTKDGFAIAWGRGEGGPCRIASRCIGVRSA